MIGKNGERMGQSPCPQRIQGDQEVLPIKIIVQMRAYFLSQEIWGKNLKTTTLDSCAEEEKWPLFH